MAGTSERVKRKNPPAILSKSSNYEKPASKVRFDLYGKV